jgi:hypothetical protein
MITLKELKEKSVSNKVDEAKSSSGYELYHRDFSSAMQHAYKHAKAKLGVDVDPEEIDKKVAMGPSKPSRGKTNSYRLLDKGGKKAIQVQVYGMDSGKYELNMYKESVDINEAHDPKHVKMAIGVASDKRYKQGNYSGAVRAIEKIKKGLSKHPQVSAVLKKQNEDNEISNRSAAMKPQTYNDPKTGKKKVRLVPVNTNIVKTKDDVKEEMDPTKHVSKKGDMYCVYNKAGKEVAKFDDEEKANAYARKNHDKLMEYLEIGTDKIRTTYAAATPGQTNGGVSEFATGTDKAIAVGAVGGAAYAAKKVKDRFNPVKVAKARSDRDEKKKERDKAERELAQRRDYQKKLRDMRDRQNKQRNKK